MHVHIIGGGIAGASVAYHLLKLNQEVTIYDRSDQGQATQASAGIICPWTSQRRNKAWYRLVKEGAKYYPSFIEELEAFTLKNTGFQQNGALCLFKDSHIQNLAYERIRNKQSDSPEMGEVIKLTADALKTYHPDLTTDFPAVYVEGGAQVSGRQLLEALKIGIKKLGGSWVHKHQDPNALEGTIVYAAGAWSNECVKEEPVRHQRAELLSVTLESSHSTKDVPVIMGMGPMYIVPETDSSYLIGTTHDDTESFEVDISDENRNYLFEQSKRYFKQTTLKMGPSSIGLRPLMDQNLPFIGKVGNIYMINGLGSSGLTVAPVIGRELANKIVGHQTLINLSDYDHRKDTKQ